MIGNAAAKDVQHLIAGAFAGLSAVFSSFALDPVRYHTHDSVRKYFVGVPYGRVGRGSCFFKKKNAQNTPQFQVSFLRLLFATAPLSSTMPTLQKVLTSPDNGIARGTFGGDKSIGNPSSKKRTVSEDVEEPTNEKAKQKKKKKKSASKSNTTEKAKKKRASKANTAEKSEGSKKKKTKTIRDFYSLSPKQDSDANSPGSTDESTTANEEVTPMKKRRAKKSIIALNDDAKPIHVHIPFVGQTQNSLVTIESHCVESKYDLGDEPLVLTGTYPRHSKIHIERFLSGFGRYIH